MTSIKPLRVALLAGAAWLGVQVADFGWRLVIAGLFVALWLGLSGCQTFVFGSGN